MKRFCNVAFAAVGVLASAAPASCLTSSNGAVASQQCSTAAFASMPSTTAIRRWDSAAAPTFATASSTHFLAAARRSQSHISPAAIANVKKGTPAIAFTPYKVFHVVSKHDPKLRGRHGAQLLAMIYNKFHRLTGKELAGYKRSAQKLNRLRTLASQRLLLSSIVLQKFGVENYRRIYPHSSVTVGGASRAARRMLESTYPKRRREEMAAKAKARREANKAKRAASSTTTSGAKKTKKAAVSKKKSAAAKVTAKLKKVAAKKPKKAAGTKKKSSSKRKTTTADKKKKAIKK